MSSELVVLAWFWRQPRGATRYAPWMVNVWADSVRRNLSIPHRIACVTDTPEGLDPRIEIIEPPRDFEHVRIPTWGENRPQCHRRLAMFAPDAAERFGERFLCMDLDCVISGPLDPLITDHDFRIHRGSSPARPYNGSMLLLTAGSRRQVYDQFTPERAAEAGRRFLGSDQAWIMHCLGPYEATWGPEDGVDWWAGTREGGLPEPERLLFLCGSQKPWDLLGNPFVARHYRRDGGRNGLVLGHRPGVWNEARAALAREHFDGAIALPQVAELWPGEVEATFETREERERLVQVLGFDTVTECGVRSAKAA